MDEIVEAAKDPTGGSSGSDIYFFGSYAGHWMYLGQDDN